MSDRFKDLSPAEQRAAIFRRGGEDIYDRRGRLRLSLGDGPESQILRAIHAREDEGEHEA